MKPRGYRHAGSASRSFKYPALATLFMIFLCLASSSRLGVSQGNPPAHQPTNFDQRVLILQTLEVSVVPLYILGDVNEDGKVDETDRALIRVLAQSPGKPAITSAIPCPAAADLSLNGEINEKDVQILENWLKDGAVLTIPALDSQSFLPCKFSNMFVAAKLDIPPGGVMPIRFLDLNLTTSNCTVTVQEGRGVVKPAAGGRGFDVEVPADAKAEDIVTLLISLPEGKRYYYTFPIRPYPPKGGKGPS